MGLFGKLGAEDKSLEVSARTRSRTEGARADGEGRGQRTQKAASGGGAVAPYLHPLDHGKQVRGLGKRVDTKSKKEDKRVRQFTAASAHLSSPAQRACRPRRSKANGKIRAPDVRRSFILSPLRPCLTSRLNPGHE